MTRTVTLRPPGSVTTISLRFDVGALSQSADEDLPGARTRTVAFDRCPLSATSPGAAAKSMLISIGNQIAARG